MMVNTFPARIIQDSVETSNTVVFRGFRQRFEENTFGGGRLGQRRRPRRREVYSPMCEDVAVEIERSASSSRRRWTHRAQRVSILRSGTEFGGSVPRQVECSRETNLECKQ